ncbi:LptA/OstA family protein [Brevundimonas sp.]|jgi:lipopolysaccharide export system protein LptA|uniref:LptA/OstA family protein n=1 Tax=Brevundimonas sp. TaxID=1871086 RepID=UPI002E0F0ED3|nr:LptA/OstA family protein [Brevundimonas sp.]
MSTRKSLGALAAAVALTLPAAGGAQVAPSSADAPIYWGGDEVIYEGSMLSLVGRVELTQGENRLRADRVSGLNQSGDSVIRATGNVFFVTPEQTIRGDAATYTTATATLVVSGDVILAQGQNVATGSRLTYDVRTESARLEGRPTPNGSRVQGVFYPDE